MPVDKRKAIALGGLGLIGLGGLLWLEQGGQKAKASPPPVPPPVVPPPRPATVCLIGHSYLLRSSRWYNWSDLATLPLDPNQAPAGPTTGGTTDQTGTPVNAALGWSEVKYGTAGDGATGWFVRVWYGPGLPGAWALPAGDVAPCT